MRIEANGTSNRDQSLVTESVLIDPDLSYKIVGAAFAVYNQLGSGYQEKYYQRSLAIELDKQKIKYQREVLVPLNYANKSVGRYFLDFLIENRIVVELKVGAPRGIHMPQVLSYLTALKKKLAILVYFT